MCHVECGHDRDTVSAKYFSTGADLAHLLVYETSGRNQAVLFSPIAGNTVLLVKDVHGNGDTLISHGFILRVEWVRCDTVYGAGGRRGSARFNGTQAGDHCFYPVSCQFGFFDQFSALRHQFLLLSAEITVLITQPFDGLDQLIDL